MGRLGEIGLGGIASDAAGMAQLKCGTDREGAKPRSRSPGSAITRYAHRAGCYKDVNLRSRWPRGVNSSVDPTRHRALKAPVTCWRAFKRLTQLSFPRSYPIVQFPNAPLILAFASGLLAQHSHGREHTYAQAVSYLAMAIWAYLELFQGVNAFRRLLGLAYTISTAVHLANALHH